jgi:IclR family pca regulon transcriptional regulator
MKTNPGSDRILASSLVRGLLVLECFSPHKDNYTLADLSKLVDIPKSSLYRVVKTLSEMNYLRYDEQSKRYYLGTRVLSLGFSVLQSMELREIARPYLEKLSRECSKTVNLAILDKHEMVYVERVRVPGIREFNISIGNRIPVWNTAVGKAVLAYLEPEKLKSLLKQLRQVSEFKIGQSGLAKALERVRKDGYAINDQEFLRGIRAVAVPIFSPDGVNCAINIVVEPEEVSIDELRNYYAPKLIRVGKELSGALGCRA